MLSHQNFNLAILMEKLFFYSLSRNSDCIVAIDLLLILKNNKNLSYYMVGLTDVFNNHPLDMLCLIRESCEEIELPALKSKSVVFIE